MVALRGIHNETLRGHPLARLPASLSQLTALRILVVGAAGGVGGGHREWVPRVGGGGRAPVVSAAGVGGRGEWAGGWVGGWVGVGTAGWRRVVPPHLDLHLPVHSPPHTSTPLYPTPSKPPTLSTLSTSPAGV